MSWCTTFLEHGVYIKDKGRTVFAMSVGAEVVDERCSVCEALERGIQKASIAKVCQASADTARRRPLKRNDFQWTENAQRNWNAIFTVHHSTAVTGSLCCINTNSI